MMMDNDELAGRMARMDAARLRVSPPTLSGTPRPAGIPWVPIADMPDAWKDGRRVLGWIGRSVVLRWADRFAAVYGDTSPGWYLREDDDRAYPTHVAAINPPEGR